MDDNRLQQVSFDAETKTVAFTYGGLVFGVSNITFAPNGVKAKITISKDGKKALARDLVALASDAARRKLARQLPGQDEGRIVAALMQIEDALLALAPRLEEKGDTYPSDVTGTPPHPVSRPEAGESVPATLPDVEAAYRKWLFLPDLAGLHFALAVVAGHRLGGDPLWGFIVGPPSSAKTEIIRSLEGVRGVFPLSELTARTFASGLEAGGREPSLLPRLKDNILTLKDFTTVLTMHRDERQGVLGQLREIYDGRFDKTWGTGKELHWTGRLGLLAGVTCVIDTQYSVHQTLGERFVLFRMDQPDRRRISLAALRGRGHEEAMRQELKEVVARFLASLDYQNPPTLPPIFEERLAALADFVSRARSGVVRDPYSREMVLAPDPEGPARLVKQLAGLAVAHAFIRGSASVEDSDYTFVYCVGLDSLPQIRLRAIEALESADVLNTSKVAATIGYSTTTARRTLEELTALHVVTIEKAEQRGEADKWALSPLVRSLLGACAGTLLPEPESDTNGGTFPVTSEGGIGCENEEVVAVLLPAAPAGDDRRKLALGLWEGVGFTPIPYKPGHVIFDLGRWLPKATDEEVARVVELLEAMPAPKGGSE